MIIYSSNKKGFCDDVQSNQIERTILSSFVREVGHSTGQAEVNSWRNSMMYMKNIMSDADIPDDAGVAIEYRIPQTSKRIDFILTGGNDTNDKVAILIELKQWSEAELTDLDGMVKTYVGGAKREVNHPSYQAWSYAMLLDDFNSSVQDNNISINPCAYLHNYLPDNVITNEFYKEYLDKAPIFLRDDVLKLQSFIKRFVKYGGKKNVLYSIENGRIRPSKSLADCLDSMLHGNPEFTLIDEQKHVFETALKLVRESNEKNKNVLIVEGGPGTGKSIVAINLLATLTNSKFVAQYVTKNSAPREVYQAKLTGKFSKSRISNLFCSSGSFYDIAANTFDSLIIDEAHRLNAKSGMFSHLGENQIKELISAAKCSIFFIDEDQRVTLKDIGTKDEIINWANKLGAKATQLELESQFRCNGSDGYLAWIDNLLQIRPTANETYEGFNYDFQVIGSPLTLHKKIIELNKIDNKARMLAGYCWKWVSKNNKDVYDFIIGDYKAQWNLNIHGQAWIIHKDSVNEVGCIHTCQGLELNYAGIIIGPDLVVRNGIVITDPLKRAAADKSLHGYKKLYEIDPEKAKKTADMIIKNTYRTLLTRAMRGSYVYSTDPETQEYLIQRLKRNEKNTLIESEDGASLTIDG